MRLLLDENISWRLTEPLRPHCQAVVHVRDIGLAAGSDSSIWRYAKQHQYDLLTKDEDFVRMVLTEGFPPRVVALHHAQLPAKELTMFVVSRLPQMRKFLDEQTLFGLLTLRLRRD